MLRHELYGTERYSFVIWWTCVIDTHALLTGGGNGNYLETLLKHHMLPALNNPMRQSGTLKPDSPQLDDGEKPPSILEFHRMITIRAARLGLLARDLRQEASQHENQPLSAKEVCSRRQRVDQFRSRLVKIWSSHLAAFKALGYTNDFVPVRDRGIFEHVSRGLLFCVCGEFFG